MLGIGWKLEGKGAVLVQAFICITLVGGFVDIRVSTTDDVAGLNSKKKKKEAGEAPLPLPSCVPVSVVEYASISQIVPKYLKMLE